MNAPDFVGYDELDELVQRLRLGTTAAELHGSLCGLLAAGGQVGRTPLLTVLQLEGDMPRALDRADQVQLDALVTQTAAELADPELGFEPRLPSDDRPLPERADALVDWCRGFLGGFGLAGAKPHGALSDEAQELLRDLAAIGASSLDFGEESEDEDALIEVHEFVRMGAMLLHTEATAGAPDAGAGRLH